MKQTPEQVLEELKYEKNHRKWMVQQLERALKLMDKSHPAYGPVCAAAYIDTRPLTQAEIDYALTLAPTIC